MFWIIALTPCEKGSYLIIENKLYLVENPLVHLISSSCWHFTTHETFHRPTHRSEGPVTDHVSSSPTPSNINIGLGDFPANPIMKLESLLLECIGLSRAQKIASCKPHIKKKKTKKNYHYFSTPLQMNTSQYLIELPVWLAVSYVTSSLSDQGCRVVKHTQKRTIHGLIIRASQSSATFIDASIRRF